MATGFKPRMSVARCCCPKPGPPAPSIVGIFSQNWEPGGSRFNVVGNAPFSIFPAYFGDQDDLGTRFDISGVMRSNAIGVPSGTTVVSCLIVATNCLQSASGAGAGTATCDVRAEANDTATIITSAAQADAAPRGTAVISGYSHFVNEFNNVRLELDVTALAQEMINRPGWTVTSQLQFFFDRVSATTNVGAVIVEETGGAAGIANPQLEIATS